MSHSSRVLAPLKRALRPLAARCARLVLRAAGVPDLLASLRQGQWAQGGALLRERYGVGLPRGHRRSLNAYEARVFSQNGEDGILLEIFDRIGVHSRSFIELGVQDGRECNCANLAIHFGWSGLLVDGSRANIESGRTWYRAMLPDDPHAVNLAAAWVTRENVDGLLTGHGCSGEIDLLSIDLDGNDYWIFQAIESVQPRVVVLEYNASFGPERALTVPYDPGFQRHTAHASGLYHGASLAALTGLAAEKGYALVGCDLSGVNAFYVRRDLLGDLPALSAAEAWIPHASRAMRVPDTEAQFQAIRHLDLEEVSGT